MLDFFRLTVFIWTFRRLGVGNMIMQIIYLWIYISYFIRYPSIMIQLLRSHENWTVCPCPCSDISTPITNTFVQTIFTVGCIMIKAALESQTLKHSGSNIDQKLREKNLYPENFLYSPKLCYIKNLFFILFF